MVTKLVHDSAAALDAGTVPDWISDHLRAYRESGGQAGHYWDATAVGGHGDDYQTRTSREIPLFSLERIG